MAEVTPKSALQKTVDEITGYSRRTRKVMWALAASLVLDITLTVVLSIVAFQAHGTADTNSQLVQEVHMQQVALHAAQLSACAGGNTFRADQNVIWKDFIRILTTPTATSTKAQVAKADKLAAQFLAYVSTVNHAVNCAKLYGSGEAP